MARGIRLPHASAFRHEGLDQQTFAPRVLGMLHDALQAFVPLRQALQ